MIDKQILLASAVLVSMLLSACDGTERSLSRAVVDDPNLPEGCTVREIETLFPMSGGFAVSPLSNNTIVYAKPEEDIFQIFRRNLDTTEDVCLTCDDISNGPAQEQHKGAPVFHPDGEHVILQVEMEEHPYEDRLGQPGPGWFNNLWMATVDGQEWWQLTDYPHGENDRYGVLLPQISPDGSKVVWAELYQGDPIAQARYALGDTDPGGDPWGKWRIALADLDLSAGVPALTNVEHVQPEGGTFFEPQQWSPDGRQVLFATDINRDTPHKVDLWVLDVETRTVTPVTDVEDAWVEFASFSPNGSLVAFMSSEGTAYEPSMAKKELASELYMMDLGGSGRVQLTNLNQDSADRYIVTKVFWNAQDNAIYFGLPFFGKRGNPKGSYLARLSFAGNCGL